MAQNMGFGSALTGFGSGYLNALKAGRAEQNSLLSAKLRKDALAQKKQESAAASQLRALQMEDMLDARAFRRKDSENKAAYNNNRLLATAQGKVTDFYTKMQPYLKAQTPEQRKTTHDSMRSSVSSMLVAGGMDPKLAAQQAEQMIKPYGAQLQDEMVDVPYAPNMEKEGLISSGVIPESSVGKLGALTPDLGQSTPWELQQDGTYGRVGKFAMDPSLRYMTGMLHVLGSDPVQLAYNATQGGLKPQDGFSQFAPSAYGVTEQRSALTKQVPATATYGMDELTRSQVGKNDASTGLAKVRTQQLVDLFPAQSQLLQSKISKLAADMGLTKERTKFISLNYDLDLRKHAAQVAHQKAMEALGSGQLDVAQKNLALRKVGLRLKAIIDPTRIATNASAIISDLTRARNTPGANTALIDQQIARLKREQELMKDFSHITDDPRKLNDMKYMSQIFAGQVAEIQDPQTLQELSALGLSKSPYKTYDTLLRNSSYGNPFWDESEWDNEDYMDNSDLIPGWNGFAAAAAANPRPNPLLRNPRTQSNGGIPGFTR